MRREPPRLGPLGRRGRSLVAFVLFAASFAGTWSPWDSTTATAATQSLYHPPAKPKAARASVITRGPDSLQLLSQTPWLGPGAGQFQLHLKITAADPAAEMLEVNVYSELTTRSEFQAALGGGFYGLYYEAGGGPIPLGDLKDDPSGGVDLNVPVNEPDGGLQLSATGVYPVQAFLEEDGVPRGHPLTTFIVFAGQDASSFRRLEVSLVVPLRAKVAISPLGTPGEIAPGEAGRIDADASDLARADVPVTLQPDVATIESLSKGGSADKAAVADLREALSSGDELLPATALPIDLPGLVGSGLISDLREELLSGGADLSRLLGSWPALTTWAFRTDIDPTSVSVLTELGATEVAVPEGDLSALPLSDEKFTFALPSKLSVGGPDIDAVGADSELSERLSDATKPGEAVLVANQVLAELAMIDMETPNDMRGVVIMPPPRVAVGPVFLSVLLHGLHDDPLVRAVALHQLFSNVPLATAEEGGPMVRQLEGQAGAAGVLKGVGQLQAALGDVESVGEVYGANSSLVNGFSQSLFVSLSSAFSTSQRASMIAGVLGAARSALGKVRLPRPVSITLTSRQGGLPLTVYSTAGSPVRILLVLTSEQLSFLQANFTEGSCVPVHAGGNRGPAVSEDCQLTLSGPTTILRVPVVVRAPGAFPLSLQVETPSGTQVLKTTTDTVRSTAISDIGYVLIVVAGLFLAIWWIRNARHGRRARQLMPKPEDEAGAGTPPGAGQVGSHGGPAGRLSH
ncbi:MAG TPA: DUF6049 family protein [Acidimicrobiales bacterium]|nr:DUF6049 family protein [Acidimicrobiales bacterium]